jgi:hypothetical protein
MHFFSTVFGFLQGAAETPEQRVASPLGFLSFSCLAKRRACGVYAAVTLLIGCRGAALDVTFEAQDPTPLRTLRLGVNSAPLISWPDGGSVVLLPATLRLLVDTTAFVLDTTAIDIEGNLRRSTDAVGPFVAGSVNALRVDLTPVKSSSACPAPTPEMGALPVYDEGPRGRVAFGYDQTRLSEPDSATLACSGTRFIEYAPRARYDGFGLTANSGTALRRVELRWWASSPSQWLVGVADTQTTSWLPNPDACSTDTLTCALTARPEWQLVVLDVPPQVSTTLRLVLQLDSDPVSPLTIRVDDVRVVLR